MRTHSVIAVCTLLSAQLNVSAAQPTTFHAGARLVEINVVVRNKKAPITDLTQKDFVVTEGGKQRPLSVFSVGSSQQPAATATPGAVAAPSNTFSNRRRDGSGPAAPPSVTIVLIDRLNTLAGSGSQPYEDGATWLEDGALANARQQLLKFVATLEPQSRIAIYSLGKTLTVLTDFTGDRDQLRAALEKDRANVSLSRREDVDPHAVHIPNGSTGFNGAIDGDRLALAALLNRGRAEITMGALMSIAAHVAHVEGRKNLVWLTANLPFSQGAAARILSRANVAAYPMDARGLLTRDITSLPAVTPESMAGLRRGGGISQGIQPIGLSSMEVLASETGGRALVNGNDLVAGMREIVADASVTYKLGFYVDAESLDGKFHELKVRVPHTKYEVSAPRGYYASRDQPMDRHSRVIEALVTPLEYSAIGLAVRIGHADQPQPGSLAVTSTIDVHDLELTGDAGAWTGGLDIYIFEQDGTGGLLGQLHRHYNLHLTNQLRDNYLRSGMPFRETFAPRAGMTTLRVLVMDANSANAGSLIIPASKLEQ